MLIEKKIISQRQSLGIEDDTIAIGYDFIRNVIQIIISINSLKVQVSPHTWPLPGQKIISYES